MTGDVGDGAVEGLGVLALLGVLVPVLVEEAVRVIETCLFAAIGVYESKLFVQLVSMESLANLLHQRLEFR